MKKRFGREILLLMVPLLVIGGVALWREWNDSGRRDGAPEDLRRGKARVLVRWESQKLSPFDVYRGYVKRFRLISWLAGDFPSAPPIKGITRTVGIPRVEGSLKIKENGLWKQVGYNPVLVESVPYRPTTSIRQEQPVAFSLEEASAQATEIRWRGYVIGAYKDDYSQSGQRATTGEMWKYHFATSGWFEHSLWKQGERPMSPVSRFVPVELKQMRVPTLESNLNNHLHFKLRWKDADKTQDVRVQLHKMYIYDARGCVVTSVGSWTSNQDVDQNHEIELTFFVTDWRRKPDGLTTAPRPLTLRGAVSFNEMWPFEFNTELSESGEWAPPRPSKLPQIQRPKSS